MALAQRVRDLGLHLRDALQVELPFGPRHFLRQLRALGLELGDALGQCLVLLAERVEAPLRRTRGRVGLVAASLVCAFAAAGTCACGRARARGSRVRA